MRCCERASAGSCCCAQFRMAAVLRAMCLSKRGRRRVVCCMFVAKCVHVLAR